MSSSFESYEYNPLQRERQACKKIHSQNKSSDIDYASAFEVLAHNEQEMVTNTPRGLGALSLVVSQLDTYYTAACKRNTAITLVNPSMTAEQRQNYQNFVNMRQQSMISAAKICIDTYFDITQQPTERASFVTGIIMATQNLEANSLEDLIDYREIRGGPSPLSLVRALSNRIKRIQRNSGDDQAVRDDIFEWYHDTFSDRYVRYLQEYILETKHEQNS